MGITNLFRNQPETKYSIGIAPDKEQKKLFIKQESETKELLKDFLIKSGRYKADYIDKLIKKMKNNINNVFCSGELLSLEEKKGLGLNSRKKYGRDYINSLTVLGLKDGGADVFFRNSYAQAFHIISRKYYIEKLKKAGIKKCKISPCHDVKDCKAISLYSGRIFPIDEIPDLPLKECDAPICRCTIIASLED